MRNQIHGAKWWKFDFHNHSPASDDFGKGDQLHKEISPEEWLLMYMNAKIDCVAITDHNSGKWIDILKDEYSKMESTPHVNFRPIHIFPGVEITASNNVHILAVFDKSADSSTISAILGAVKFPTDHFGRSDAVSSLSVEAIINEIHQANGIAIPAHVDKPSGLFTQVTGVTLDQTIKTEGLLAIEVIDKSVEKPELYNQAKLDLAEVIGSDSHISAQVGTKYTWVKMGEPSLPALKLALHDREDGIIKMDEISIEPNSVLNRYFIKSISIKSGFKAGNGSALVSKFSPWLTSVIGGRGSGKSTIVNYLRIALSRTDEMPEEVQVEFDKFNQIGKANSTGMLRNNTAIELEIYKDGKLHLVTWENSYNKLQEWNETRNSWDDAQSISNIKELFPVQIFNQKELYALTGDPSKLIELIDSQFDKKTWIEEKEKLTEKWLALRATRRQLGNAIAEEANITAQLSSTNNKISIFESSTYKETLNNFNKLTKTSKFFADTSDKASTFFLQLEELKQAVPTIIIPEEINDIVVDDSLNYLNSINTALASVKDKLTQAITTISPFKENLLDQFNTLPWFEQFEAAKEAYDGIEESIKELSNEPYEALIQNRATLADKLALINTQKEQLQKVEGDLQILYSLIIEKEQELRIKRDHIINRWKEIDDPNNPFLIIELHPLADAKNAEESFRQLLRKPGGEFADYIYSYDPEDEQILGKGLISEIINEAEQTRWEKRFTLITRFLSATEADKKHLDLRLAKHIDYLKQNTPEDIDRILIWVPEDKLVGVGSNFGHHIRPFCNNTVIIDYTGQ